MSKKKSSKITRKQMAIRIAACAAAVVCVGGIIIGMMWHWGVIGDGSKIVTKEDLRITNPETPEEEVQFEYQQAQDTYDLDDVLPNEDSLSDGIHRMSGYTDDGDGNIYTSIENPQGYHFVQQETDNPAQFKTLIADKDERMLQFVMENGTGTYRYEDDNSYAGIADSITHLCILCKYLDGTVDIIGYN